MFNGKKILAIIPARGGSKGIPGKNIKTLHGKPLIAWTIEAAKKSNYIDRLILSSDDPAIIAVASTLGCEVPFTRPSEFSADESGSMDVIFHALGAMPGFDYVLLLQPTSPLRETGDIDACIEMTFSRNRKSCVSLAKSPVHPFLIFQLGGDSTLLPIAQKTEIRPMRRQDLPSAFVLNGALYFAEIEWLKGHKSFISNETLGYEMPPERSVDIDEPDDWATAEKILRKRR